MSQQRKELILHLTMCFQGGFLGGYTIISRCGNFGNAQTTNIIQILLTLLGRNFHEFCIRFLGLVIYCMALFICTFLANKTTMQMERYAIINNIVGLLLLSFLPANLDPFIGILPVFYMAATQWFVFHGTQEYNCSTIFSTNNLKQFITSLSEYLLLQKEVSKRKAYFFAMTLFSYYIGVIISFFSCQRFEISASLLCIPFMLFAWMITLQPNPKNGIQKIENGGISL